ncbi:hypothetical protein CRUP_038342 [Coryphaenoides rupestris]|nr:hypothetical protein CRUP_038342 [Coryphaenoides rupestris]
MWSRHHHHLPPHHLPPHHHLPPPPPVQNLPHWTRVGFLHRPAKPLTPAGPREVEVRNLAFLQRQQQETLQHLHAEIDHLKRENKVRPWWPQRRHTPVIEGSGRDSGRGRRQRGLPGSAPAGGPLLTQETTTIHHTTDTPSSADHSETPGAGPAVRGPELRAGLITSLLLAAYPISKPRAPPQGPHSPARVCRPRPVPAHVSAGVVLPALRQSLGSTVAERQKRAQAAAAAHRSRLKRAVQRQRGLSPRASCSLVQGLRWNLGVDEGENLPEKGQGGRRNPRREPPFLPLDPRRGAPVQTAPASPAPSPADNDST